MNTNENELRDKELRGMMTFGVIIAVIVIFALGVSLGQFIG